MENKVTDTNQTGSSGEGSSLIRWILFLKKHRRTVLYTFIIVFLAGVLFTFLSPKYYQAKTSFFFPLPSGSMDIFSSLGLSELLNEKADLTTYAVAIMESATLSNRLIDRYGPQLFGKSADLPRVELIYRLKAIVRMEVINGKIVEITVDTRDPKLSADVANYMVQLYREFTAGSNLSIAKSLRVNLEKQRDKTGKELTGLENRLLAFQNREKVIDPPAEMESLLKYYSDIKAMSVVTSVTYNQSLSRIDALREKYTRQASQSLENSEYSQMMDNPGVSNLYQQMTAKETELARRMQTMTPENPAVIKLQDEISSLNQSLRKIISSRISSISDSTTPAMIEAYSDTISQGAKKKALDKVVEELDNRFQEIPELASSYRRIYRDILIKEKLLGYLEIEVEKARSKEYSNPNQIQILDKAVPPDLYSRPVLRWYLLGAIILALVSAVLSAKIAETAGNIRTALKQD